MAPDGVGTKGEEDKEQAGEEQRRQGRGRAMACGGAIAEAGQVDANAWWKMRSDNAMPSQADIKLATCNQACHPRVPRKKKKKKSYSFHTISCQLTIDKCVPLQVRVRGGLRQDAGQHKAGDRVVLRFGCLQDIIRGLLRNRSHLRLHVLHHTQAQRQEEEVSC